MPVFSIRYPYFIIVVCLIVCVLGVTSVTRMAVDLFPPIKIPVVVVATFYNGMPPEQIENDITGPFERFFTLAANVDHIESRSLPGVSLVKVYFQPGANPDSSVTAISNLAMAQLRRLPPGTLPPVVLSLDASSLPVCLITLKGQGLSETQLRDLGQFTVRNQIAGVPGASVPQPFGGRYRQIMVYVDPAKLEAHELSVMDVVRAVNQGNLILPAGDVPIGPFDYTIYTNSQLNTIQDINELPLKIINDAPVTVGDVGYAKDGSSIQYNLVRIDGQPSVYLPIFKQGGNANTISIVSAVKDKVKDLLDVPKSLVTNVVFDQSVFVKTAIENLIHEGSTGLVLTGLMILIFLGNFRATVAVFLSIPLSALATFFFLYLGDSSINSMILGGLALVFSRLIDNSVVVLENIFRHMEEGEDRLTAAQNGGNEVVLPVLAATLTTAIVFFPVTLLTGVSLYIFSALAMAVVIALFVSYFIALTVVPLFCANLINPHVSDHEDVSIDGKEHSKFKKKTWNPMAIFNRAFNYYFEGFLNRYESTLNWALKIPFLTVLIILAISAAGLLVLPLVGLAYFPRTDPGQFIITVKCAPGTRLDDTNKEVAKVEAVVRQIVEPADMRLIVSNLGTTADFSAIFNPNSATNCAFVQVSLQDDHKVGSYAYMDKVRTALAQQVPEVTTYFQSGGLVDAVLNLGLPAPIDIQVSCTDLKKAYATASDIAHKVRDFPEASDVLIPQDIDAPSLRLTVDRVRAGKMGLTQQEVVSNVITALTSDGMIAPSFWIDPKSGNNYLMTVQYPEGTIKTFNDLASIPLRAPGYQDPTRLDMIADITHQQSSTEIDHQQLFRTIDVYVSTRTENLGTLASQVQKLVNSLPKQQGVRVRIRGSVTAMNDSFSSFETGLLLSVLLVYLILVAQFRSFIDPFLILLAVPPGIMGVIVLLWATDTTLNVMSLMGVVMMVGIVVSNSILIVEFTHRLIDVEKYTVARAVSYACRVRLRPILMTSLATIFGLIPMALKLGTGSEAYAPLARAIIGGLCVSVVLTVYIVPAAFLMVYGGRDKKHKTPEKLSPRKAEVEAEKEPVEEQMSGPASQEEIATEEPVEPEPSEAAHA